MSTRDRKEGLKVYGPVGIKDWLEFNLTAIHARLRYPLTIYEYSNNGEVIAQGSSYKIIAYTLLHRCFSSAFRLELGQGSSFRVITIFGDTEPHPNELMAAKNANIVVHEATYQETLRNKAKNHQHSTALQAAQMAKKAGATDSITLTGGCAKNEGLKRAIEHVLKIKVVDLPIDPQLMGALGAAEYARQKGMA